MNSKKLLMVSLVVLSMAGGIGCANRSKIEMDIDRLRGDMNDLRSVQADQLAQIAALRSDLSQVRGRIEEIEHDQTAKVAPVLSAVKDDLSALRQRIPPPAIVPVELLEQDLAVSDGLEITVQERYTRSLEEIREGKFAAARSGLEEVLDEVHGTTYAPAVVFWIGLASEGMNQNENAVKRYTEIVASYPKDRHVPPALYRQASVLIRLGDAKTAKIVFKKLIADYPRSTEAARARDRLKDL